MAIAGDPFSTYLRHRFNADQIEMSQVTGLKARVTDARIHLRVRDFLELMLKNSPEVQLTRLDIYTANNQITGAGAPFDPIFQANFTAQRSITPLFFGGGFSQGGTNTGSGSGGQGSATGPNDQQPFADLIVEFSGAAADWPNLQRYV